MYFDIIWLSVLCLIGAFYSLLKINKNQLHFVVGYVLLFFILAFFMKSCVLDFIKINGHSMNPTLYQNDKVFVNKIIYGLRFPLLKTTWIYHQPHQGEIIAFDYKNTIWIKRVGGVSGNLLEFIPNQGWYVNKKYIASYTDKDPSVYSSLEIPSGYLFVLGDNREHSTDSRYIGLIPQRNIIGKVYVAQKNI